MNTRTHTQKHTHTKTHTHTTHTNTLSLSHTHTYIRGLLACGIGLGWQHTTNQHYFEISHTCVWTTHIVPTRTIGLGLQQTTIQHITKASQTQKTLKKSYQHAESGYVVAKLSRLFKIVGLFYRRALQKRLYSVKETYIFKEPTDRSHPISWYDSTIQQNWLKKKT